MPGHDTTRDLTSAIASGDSEAFASLYRERFDQMYAWARQATRRDEAFCLDSVQDAFVRIIKGMRPIASDGELMSWLRKVTLSACYDQLRRDKRRARRELTDPGQSESSAPADERLAWILDELAQLDDESAALIEMRYRFGWTLERIGRAAGLKPGAVDGRVARAIRKLRDNAAKKRVAREGEVLDES